MLMHLWRLWGGMSEAVENTGEGEQPDPRVMAQGGALQVAKLRARVHETFGKVALAMVALPRYRHLSIAELAPVLLEPLIRDRVALASKGDAEDADALAGVVIWASVSEEVDAKIREQIKAGVFPVRLAADDWTSGDTHWLLDVIAPTPALATSVLANMKQVVKDGDLCIHPVVTRLVEAGALEKLGALPSNKVDIASETEN